MRILEAIRWLPAAAGLCMASVSPCAAGGEISSHDLNKAFRLQQKADRALGRGSLSRAAALYGDAVELVPDLPPAHVGLGQIAMAQEQFDLALEHFEQAREGYNELGEALIRIESKRYANARSEIQSLRDSIQQLQNQAGARWTALRISQLENRITQLEVIEPPDRDTARQAPGEIFFYIGNALFRLDRLEQAVAAWETCRQRSPRFSVVYNNLALAYGRQGKLREALVSLDKAEELGFPVNPQFRADLERALAQSGS